MTVYLIQHAKALPKEADPQQPLSKEGLKELAETCAFLKNLKLSVDFLWHSEKLRAIQTATEISKVITVKREIVKRPDLAPNDDVRKIADEIAQNSSNIMVVGHLPFLSRLASFLLTGSEDNGIIAFRNCGVAALSKQENFWQIEWLVTPAVAIRDL